ncbi:hypothetical protein OSB04_012748 [Centaurea solstitialis]|uniref:USP domain-containing protein n=1 Tax=Centaurea solstitialis TaxID=347529 RepID=A0AA38TBY3_9ASTR|nr:hypothetical protein OSB04_012748 [Centaurea solstitialis]
MADQPQVVLFGSFSEDEVKSWFDKPSGNTKQPVKEKALDLDTLKISSEISFGSFNDESYKNTDSSKGSNSNSTSICKNGTSNHSEAIDNLKPKALIHSKENGKLPVNGNMELKQGICVFSMPLYKLFCRCSAVVQLFQGLKTHNIHKTGYPTLAAIAEFISEFKMPAGASPKDMNHMQVGRPFSPAMFEVVLKNFTPDVSSSISGRPRQEDAQEFLSFIMHQMHDELLKLKGQSSSASGNGSSLVSSIEDDDWETVGPKNKSAVTRTQKFAPSELSAIFGGELRSVVKARGNKASATVQPFLLLHLDISPEAVATIEMLFGYILCQKHLTSWGRDSKKSVNLQTLPKIMILHLKRFGYGTNGSTKLHKPVRFPLELVLSRDLLVSTGNRAIDDSEAKAVAATMVGLRRIELRFGRFGDLGVSEILTKCKWLNHLNIEGSGKVELGGDVMEKCERLEYFQGPEYDYSDEFLSGSEDGDEIDSASKSESESD